MKKEKKEYIYKSIEEAKNRYEVLNAELKVIDEKLQCKTMISVASTLIMFCTIALGINLGSSVATITGFSFLLPTIAVTPSYCANYFKKEKIEDELIHVKAYLNSNPAI